MQKKSMKKHIKICRGRNYGIRKRQAIYMFSQTQETDRAFDSIVDTRKIFTDRCSYLILVELEQGNLSFKRIWIFMS